MEDHSAEPLVEPIDFVDVFTTDKKFSTRDSLLEWVRGEAMKLGFVIVTTRSDNGSDRRRQSIVLGCERGGVYKKSKKQLNHQDTKSKKCECPFRLRGYFLSSGVWKVNVVCGKHNHEMTENLQGHPIASRLNVEEKKLVYEMINNMVLPKDILMTLKKRRPDNVTTIKHIYNACRRYKKSKKEEADAVVKEEADVVVKEEHPEISIKEEMEAIQAWFDSADYDTKIYIKDRLRQIAFPETTSPYPSLENGNGNLPAFPETTSPCPSLENGNGNPPAFPETTSPCASLENGNGNLLAFPETTSPCPSLENGNGNPPAFPETTSPCPSLDPGNGNLPAFLEKPSLCPSLDLGNGNPPLAYDFETLLM
ncbi:uncharacterized protein LOC127096711 isoform X2 [Lathyrus oleraceus]|uniref:uncharacterized protein LOC127096711 isoform X2 n=1 Tax=Pisum sativum TaxID=3888 RepID=UPI0021D3C75A|nr:uncharacterized protein LOC127096711 isoform X2 [Pisum sativum]